MKVEISLGLKRAGLYRYSDEDMHFLNGLIYSPNEDEYTHIDSISKEFRELIVFIYEKTGAKGWHPQFGEDMMFGSYFDIVFEYDFVPKQLSEKERLQLTKDIKEHATTSEGLCEKFEFAHKKNVTRKCANCKHFSYWHDVPACMLEIEKLAKYWVKLDNQKEKFKLEKAFEIVWAVEAFKNKFEKTKVKKK